MYNMILNNGKELNVKGIVDLGGYIEIEFAEDVTYMDIAETYDATLNPEVFSEDALRRFELHNEENELIGTHIGYTEVKNILAFNGVVKVQIAKELELKTDVEQLKKDSEQLEILKEELVAAKEELIMTNLYMTDLELELFEIKMKL